MSTTFSTGIPNLFTSPMTAFPSRNLFHSTERPSESSLSGTTFTHEDRLMLQLLYQQQQSIQIQLQSIALSMQQLHMTVAGLSVKQSVVVPSYGLSGSTVNDVSPSAHTTASANVVKSTSVHNTLDTSFTVAPPGQGQGQGQGQASTSVSTSGAAGVKDVSRPCTPPQEELDASRHSGVNYSTESAPPWDPAALQLSRRSSSSMARGATRGENPLLSSLKGKLPTPTRPSTSLDESKQSTRYTAQPSSSSSLYFDPEGRGATLIKHNNSRTQQPQRIVLDNRKVDTSRHINSGNEAEVDVGLEAESGGNLTYTNRSREVESHHSKDWNSTNKQRNRDRKDGYGETSASPIGYDSQSDGYGSYETREYLKSVGIL